MTPTPPPAIASAEDAALQTLFDQLRATERAWFDEYFPTPLPLATRAHLHAILCITVTDFFTTQFAAVRQRALEEARQIAQRQFDEACKNKYTVSWLSCAETIEAEISALVQQQVKP